MTIERYIPAPLISEVLVIEDTTTVQEVRDYVYSMIPVSTMGGKIAVWGAPLNVGDRIDRSGSGVDITRNQLVPEGTIAYAIEVQA